MDPLVVRERNWIKHEEFPYTTIAGLTYDSGNYEAATALAKDLFHYDELRAEQSEREAAGSPVRLGIGVSTYTEMCGLAPSRVLGSLAYAAGGWEHASIRMLPTGKVEVITGVVGARPGARDRVVADRRRRARRAVRGRPGAARRHGHRAQGHGHLRIAVAGRRRHGPGQRLRQGAREGPRHRGRDARGLAPTTWNGPTAAGPCAATRTRARAIGEIAFAAFAAHNLPDGVEPSLDSDATYDPDNFSFPHGTHLCAVEVDTETGQVQIRVLRRGRRRRASW